MGDNKAIQLQVPYKVQNDVDYTVVRYDSDGLDEVPTGGTKHDTGKTDLSLVPLVALEHEAKALMFGQEKYGRYNYTRGFETTRLIAAALRHIHAYNAGKQHDEESGQHHLGHARACLAMLLHCEQLGTLTDNRFKKG